MIKRRTTTPLTSYQKARLQVVGHRTLQAVLSEGLSKYGINLSQWIILGWLRDHAEGMRVTALAEVLDVETPLITTLIGSLQKKDMIQVVPDPLDRRAKRLSLTETGAAEVEKVDAELTQMLAVREAGFKKHELETYFAALERFIANAQEK